MRKFHGEHPAESATLFRIAEFYHSRIGLLRRLAAQPISR
jgi:hypothetical protein